VGFHTFGYLRHFRSAAMRLLDVEAEITHIRDAGGQMTALGVYPIGIHASRFEEELECEAFREALAMLRAAHAGKRVVLSVERLDYSKGLLQRLDAIEQFLRSSGRADEMRFIFVAVPSREGVEEYRRLREDVEGRVGHINGLHSTISNVPVQFVHQSISFTELCALYALAEVALVTPLVDGMNLVAKEYVACQPADTEGTVSGVDPGVLVLSEFAGAAEVLFDALVVNPYDVEDVAGAISRALQMPRAERARRMRAMRDRVLRFDSAWWARSFVEDLAAIAEAPEPATPAGRRADAEDAAGRLAEAIRQRKRVALFLDYDGTLREIERDPAAAGPNEQVRQILDLLRAHKGVAVTIISGRTPDDLESFLGDYSEFALVAEHGAALRRPRSREWEQLDRNVSYRWKEEVGRILRLHEASTPGSFVEDKRTSLVWHYRRADPEFGNWKARELVGELEAVTANQPLHVRLGRKIVEITASHVNKAAAISRLLEEADYDLIVVAGDDTTDESMYQLDLKHMISINVGDRQTQAQYVVPDPEAFRRLLARAMAR
jgi:trehalose 6-phosphate synthase/phosphatase